MKIAKREEKWQPKLTDQEYIDLIGQYQRREFEGEDEYRNILARLGYYYPIVECLDPNLTPEEILEKAKNLRKPILL